MNRSPHYRFRIMIIRYRPKYEIASLRDALMGLIPIPTLRKSEIFLYGVIEIKPLRGFFGAMLIVIFVFFVFLDVPIFYTLTM